DEHELRHQTLTSLPRFPACGQARVRRPPPGGGLFLRPCSRDRPSLQDRKAAERRALPAAGPGYGIIAEKASPRPDAQRPAVLARTGPAAAPQRPDTCPKEGPALPDLLLLEDDAALADGLQ